MQRAANSIGEKHHVQQLDLFGSAAEDRFNSEESDLDFLVEFKRLPPAKLADTYFALLNDLRELYGRPIDLVMASAVRNRYFLEQLQATKVPLYALARSLRVRPAPVGRAKKEAARVLKAQLDSLAARVKDVPPEHLDAALDEALKQVRPAYQSIHEDRS